MSGRTRVGGRAPAGAPLQKFGVAGPAPRPRSPQGDAERPPPPSATLLAPTGFRGVLGAGTGRGRGRREPVSVRAQGRRPPGAGREGGCGEGERRQRAGRGRGFRSQSSDHDHPDHPSRGPKGTSCWRAGLRTGLPRTDRVAPMAPGGRESAAPWARPRPWAHGAPHLHAARSVRGRRGPHPPQLGQAGRSGRGGGASRDRRMRAQQRSWAGVRLPALALDLRGPLSPTLSSSHVRCFRSSCSES